MPIPVAEYVRMSTDHQQYSIENQHAAIRDYAVSHNFSVIETYADPAKNGLMLKIVPSYGGLLQDVVSGGAQI
jgi:DNA invertase Pin-like site-specific DNA recombinase